MIPRNILQFPGLLQPIRVHHYKICLLKKGQTCPGHLPEQPFSGQTKGAACCSNAVFTAAIGMDTFPFAILFRAVTDFPSSPACPTRHTPTNTRRHLLLLHAGYLHLPIPRYQRRGLRAPDTANRTNSVNTQRIKFSPQFPLRPYSFLAFNTPPRIENSYRSIYLFDFSFISLI